MTTPTGQTSRFVLSALLALTLTAPVFSGDVPIASWAAESIEGTVVTDTSGNGHHLALKGDSVEQFMGRTLLRTGPGMYAVGPALGDGWPAFSLVAVVFQEQRGNLYAGIVCRDVYGGPDGDVFGIITDPQGNWVGRVTTDSGQTGVSAPIVPGWHQLALTYDGTAARLYVDGGLVAESKISGSLVSRPGTPLTVGAYSNLNGPYSGGVALAAIHDRALSGDELASGWVQWQQNHPAALEFGFAQGNDIHITDTKSVEILNDAVDMINADPYVAFSLWLGDLTQDSASDAMALARMGLDRLRRPYYALRGNHDLAGGYFEREFGPLNRVFEYAGWKFILLDSNPETEPIGGERIEWLRELLKATDPSQPIVLCTHHPLYPNTRAYLAPGAADVIALFKGHNLKAVLSGHYHANQEEVIDGVLYTTTACLATTRGNHDGTTPRGYRLFYCAGDTITTQFVIVRDPRP